MMGRRVAFSLVASVLPCVARPGVSVTDTLGRELRFSTPPGRIVSLNVSEQIGDIPGAQAHALAITRPAGSLLPPPPPGDPVEPVVPVRFSLR